MSNTMFQSAEDFNNRINTSMFTNIEKSYTSEDLHLEFGEHLILEKGHVDAFIQDIYKATGGEIVKGKFNDTPEANAVMEKAKQDLSELIKVKFNANDGTGVREVFVMKAKEKAKDSFSKGKDDTVIGAPSVDNPFIQKAKTEDDDEEDLLEKGKIDQAFSYTDLVKFKKSGKEIKERMVIQKAALESSIETIEAALAEGANNMTVFPTETLHQYGRGSAIKCPYKLYHYALCDYWEGRDLNQKYSTSVGTEFYPNATAEDCLPYKTHNELVDKWYDEQRDLQIIRLFQDNFVDSDKYELNAEQMIALGF